MSAGIYSAFPLVLFNSNLRDKLFGNLPRVFSAEAEKADECEGQGANEVDKQVLHGVKKPNMVTLAAMRLKCLGKKPIWQRC